MIPDLETLRNMDLKAVTAQLLTRKDLLAQVVVSAVALCILGFLVKYYLTERQQYSQQNSQLNSKTGTIQAYEDNQKTLQKFLDEIPKELEDEEQFSSHIADFASRTNVSIISFSPGMKSSGEFYRTSTAHVSVRASTYKDFLNFIKMLEGSPFALRIDSCEMSASMDNTSDREIQALMAISTVGIKK